MKGYELGKDIQMILARLEKVETLLTNAIHRQRTCGCDHREDMGQFTVHEASLS
jgi:hypothetical protein